MIKKLHFYALLSRFVGFLTHYPPLFIKKQRYFGVFDSLLSKKTYVYSKFRHFSQSRNVIIRLEIVFPIKREVKAMKTEEKETKAELGKEIVPLEVSKIVPNPNQPRKVFKEEQILRLADSIRQFGIIQPLTVRKIDGEYELVSGERRLRAAKELGMRFVPCVISSASEEESAEISIIENLIREDLNIFEQALAIETLIDTYGLTQEQIAIKLSNSQSYIANKLRLLRLSQEERDKILGHNLSERHARALLRIFDSDLRAKLLKQIIDEGLNVARTEEIIDRLVSKGEKQERNTTYKDIGAFVTAINRAIDTASKGGFKIKSRKIENENFTELTILIPKAQEDANLDSSPEIQLPQGCIVN